MREMKAARLHGVGDFRTDAVPVPKIDGDELLLKVGACGICGSDIPRIYDHGTSNRNYPMVLGHEFAGTVVAVGETADKSLIGKKGAVFPLIPCRKCDMCQIGKYVMCSNYDYLGSRRDGGFSEYVVIPSEWHFITSENPNTSMDALCMTEPACVAQHAIRQSNLAAGESIIIFGAGAIGILAARWARIFNAAHILLVDVNDRKVEFARSCGFEAINSRSAIPAEVMKDLNNGKGADVVIEGTGFGDALEGGIRAAKPMGRIVMLGNPARNQTSISLKSHSSILRKELRIIGTWNSNFVPFPINEWLYAVSMIDDGVLQTEDLITHRTTLDDLPKLCDQIHLHEVTVCKAICAMR